MANLYKQMLYFTNNPYSFLGKGKTFKKLFVKLNDYEKNIIFCRYKYKCKNKKNLRCIFIIRHVNNEYEFILLHTFIEDGDKKNSNGTNSYKKAISTSRERLKKYIEGDDIYEV